MLRLQQGQEQVFVWEQAQEQVPNKNLQHRIRQKFQCFYIHNLLVEQAEKEVGNHPSLLVLRLQQGQEQVQRLEPVLGLGLELAFVWEGRRQKFYLGRLKTDESCPQRNRGWPSRPHGTPLLT